MTNYVVLSGIVTGINEIENMLEVTISIINNDKNDSKNYDYIKIYLYNELSLITKDYCNIGDFMGVKGKIKNINNLTSIVAEKVTFLAQSKEN